MTLSLPRRPRLLARFFGFALASIFLVGQTSLSFHHHDAAPARRSASGFQSRDAGTVAPADNCALCAFQIAPGASSTVVAAVAPPSGTDELAERVAAAPRDARPGRISDRSPPAV
ncbi:MAG: hypothetical protein ACHQ2Z_03690 [Elusimicrobiota bacterium]